MPVIPPGYAHGFYRIQAQADPEPMGITLGHDLSEGYPDPQTLANRLFTGMQAALEPVVSEQYFIHSMTVYIGQDGPDSVVGESNAAGSFGSRAGSTIPQNTAILVRKITGLGGRANRGRFYIPGVMEADADHTGLLTLAASGAWQGALDDWMDTLNGVPVGSVAYPPVVLHSPGPTSALLPTPIDSFSVQGRVATQRRRLRK